MGNNPSSNKSKRKNQVNAVGPNSTQPHIESFSKTSYRTNSSTTSSADDLNLETPVPDTPTTQGNTPTLTMCGGCETSTTWDPLSPEAQQNGVPVVFTWEGGKAPPSAVYIVCGFDNWQAAIPLARSHSDFSTILYLPEGHHEYKFIVDGEWRCATERPQAVDTNGNSVNIIDLNRGETMLDTDPVLTISRPPTPAGEYSRTIPNEHLTGAAYEKAPPVLPSHLRADILSRSPDSFDSCRLPIPHHVMLNHLSILSVKDSVLVMGVSTRLQNKYVTTVIYKPFVRKSSSSVSR